DDGTAVGRQADDADGRQLAQRLADGCSTDAEFFRELFLDQPVAPVYVAGEDRGEDLADELTAEGAAGNLLHCTSGHRHRHCPSDEPDHRELTRRTACDPTIMAYRRRTSIH